MTSLRGNSRRGSEHDLRTLTREFLTHEAVLKRGGGPEAIERQHSKGRMTARERVEALLRSRARRRSRSDYGPPSRCTKNGAARSPRAS